MSILQLIITGGFVIVGILVSFAPIVKVAKQKANQLSTSDELRTLEIKKSWKQNRLKERKPNMTNCMMP